MKFIDRLNLFSTILANHQDEVQADTSTWPLAYDSIGQIVRSDANETVQRLRTRLLPDDAAIYYAWVVAAFAPWIPVAPRGGWEYTGKPPPTRAAEVARESLRSDNKTITLLRDASWNYKNIIACKSSLLEGEIEGTPSKIRQTIGLRMRSWGKDWKLCVIAAMLQEIMQGRNFDEGTMTPQSLNFYFMLISQFLGNTTSSSHTL